jgi:hypothetical protein
MPIYLLQNPIVLATVSVTKLGENNEKQSYIYLQSVQQ